MLHRYGIPMSSRAHRLIAAAGCGLGLLAVLAAAYLVGPIERADATALDGLMSLSEQHRWIWVIGDGLANSVNLPFLLAILTLIVAVGLALGRRRQVLAAVVLVVAANVLTQLLKIAASHPRYQPILAPNQIGIEAFPSGHATAAMSLALAAVIVAPSRWRPLTAVLGAGSAVAVSIALVIQGWHFPSDVLGAFLVVGMVTMLVIAGLAATEGERSGGFASERRARLRSVAAITARSAAVGLAGLAVLLLITHPDAVASYVAAQTTAVVAALGIALASLGLVSGVTAELETR